MAMRPGLHPGREEVAWSGGEFPASGGRWTTFFGAFFETTILRHDLSSQKLTDDLQIFA